MVAGVIGSPGAAAVLPVAEGAPRTNHEHVQTPPPSTEGATAKGMGFIFRLAVLEQVVQVYLISNALDPFLCLFLTVNGAWSSWSTPSGCSVTCGNGVKTINRVCTNPAPQNGGSNCTGPNFLTSQCSTGTVCPGTR